MKKEFVPALFFFCSLGIQAQQTSLCAVKKVTASIPHDVLIKLQKAIEKSDFDEIVEIAKEPHSKLVVEDVVRDKSGRIVSYLIVNSDNCYVATKIKPVP